MFRGRYAGTARSVAGDGRLGKGGLDQQGVGYDADIGTQTDEFHVFQNFILPVGPAEIGLVDDLAAVHIQTLRNFPALCSFDTVGDRELFAFRSLQIILEMCVTGEIYFFIPLWQLSLVTRADKSFVAVGLSIHSFPISNAKSDSLLLPAILLLLAIPQ